MTDPTEESTRRATSFCGITSLARGKWWQRASHFSPPSDRFAELFLGQIAQRQQLLLTPLGTLGIKSKNSPQTQPILGVFRAKTLPALVASTFLSPGKYASELRPRLQSSYSSDLVAVVPM